MRHSALHDARSIPRSGTPHCAASSPKGIAYRPIGFIVRLRHRSFGTVEFLAAAGNVALADLTPNRWAAWQFPTRGSALIAIRQALGLAIKSYTFEILPASSS